MFLEVGSKIIIIHEIQWLRTNLTFGGFADLVVAFDYLLIFLIRFL